MTSALTASNATHAASRKSESATSLWARWSSRSISSGSRARRSARSRQIRMSPEVVSTKLSMPKPSRATLPAASAAATETTPSTMFQPTVRYSSRSPRWRCSDLAGEGVTGSACAAFEPPQGAPPAPPQEHGSVLGFTVRIGRVEVIGRMHIPRNAAPLQPSFAVIDLRARTLSTQAFPRTCASAAPRDRRRPRLRQPLHRPLERGHLPAAAGVPRPRWAPPTPSSGWSRGPPTWSPTSSST